MKFKSQNGKWFSGDESAREFLKEKGIDHLGIDIRLDPEVHARAARMGKTVDQYLELFSNSNKASQVVNSVAKKRGRPLKYIPKSDIPYEGANVTELS